MLAFVEFDQAGEIVHVCEVHTTASTEAGRPPEFDAPDEDRQAFAQRELAAVQAREARVREQLDGHVAGGKRLLVLPDATPLAELHATPDRYFIDQAAGGRLRRRTDAELTSRREAQAAARAAERGPNP